MRMELCSLLADMERFWHIGVRPRELQEMVQNYISNGSLFLTFYELKKLWLIQREIRWSVVVQINILEIIGLPRIRTKMKGSSTLVFIDGEHKHSVQKKDVMRNYYHSKVSTCIRFHSYWVDFRPLNLWSTFTFRLKTEFFFTDETWQLWT